MTIPVTVPDGVSGDWRIETFTVTAEDCRLSNLRAAMGHSLEYITPGTYKKLIRGSGSWGTIVMSNTPMEIRTNQPIISAATGNVLINGLGLGMVLTAILAKPGVKEITVIEKSEDVIRLVAPTFQTNARVCIRHADAFEFRSMKGVRYNAVWHDIWDNICEDNLEGMTKLHRKYGRLTDWQDSWGRDECLRIRARDRYAPWNR